MTYTTNNSPAQMSNTPTPRIYQNLITLECVCEYCGAREGNPLDPPRYILFLDVHKQCLPKEEQRKLGTSANQKALMTECLEVIGTMKRHSNINLEDLEAQVAENSPQPYIAQEAWAAVREKLIALLNTIKDL